MINRLDTEKLEDLTKQDNFEFSEEEMLLWQYSIYEYFYENPFETEMDYSEDGRASTVL